MASPSPPTPPPPPAPPAAATMIRERIGFLGAGQMAEALARGLIAKGVVRPGQLVCTDPVQSRRDLFASLGASEYATAAEVAKNADVLVVAVKPQYAAPVLQELRPLLDVSRHVIVSIAAGITLERLLDAAGPTARCVRVMPNTPCLVGETAAAMCLGGGATPADGALVAALFGAVGRIYQVDEKLLAAVTGLSGSGPAYVFLAIEALADGGVRAGLPRDVATALAAQTVLGAAKMVLETGKHPGALKDMVTSPGGTTIAGVHELEKASTRAAFMNAVVAATQRANELSRMS
jgi:pyrroline-5-carboxylate reductase